MFRPLSYILFVLACIPTDRAHGQTDGTYDPTFIQGIGFAGDVAAITRQPDGKLLIGGDQLTIYDNVPVRAVARLWPDGALDTSFDVGTGPDTYVRDIALQPDGKIIVGGGFLHFNGEFIRRLVRLLADGTLDPNFDIGTGADAVVSSVVVQSDGKILVGGAFEEWNGVAVGGIVRLLANGALDPAFIVGVGTNARVNDILLRPNGKIVIGGDFTEYNGTTRNQLAQLNTDGTVDTSFDPGVGAGQDNFVSCLAFTAEGKILCGGYFLTWGGVTVNGMIRVESDGSRDETFSPGHPDQIRTLTIGVQADGKLLYGGPGHFGRLEPDGTMDMTFDTGTGLYGGFEVAIKILVLPDDRVLVGGQFEEYNGHVAGSIVRLTTADVGIHETAKVQLAAWPNPTDGPLTIRWANKEEASIIVRDLAGRIVLEQGPVRSGVVLSLAEAPGVYTVELHTASGVGAIRVQCIKTGH